MNNSLPPVRDINHKYIAVERILLDMKKKMNLLLTIILLYSFVLSFTSFAAEMPTQLSEIEFNAAAEQKQKEIDSLFSKKANLINKRQIVDLAVIDKQLAELGVEQLSSKEVEERFGNSPEITPYVSKPTSSNVLWYSNTIDYLLNGKKYTVQTLTAQAHPSKSSNLKHTGNITLKTSGNAKAGVLNALKIAATSAVGLNTKASVILTFYDIAKAYVSGISKTSVVTGVSASYTYSNTITASFKYVKLKGQSDSYQNLSFISTKASTYVMYSIPNFQFVNGTTKPSGVQGNYTFNSQPNGYDSTLKAVQAYKASARKTAYIEQIKINGIQGKTIGTISPVCPTFPNQIR